MPGVLPTAEDWTHQLLIAVSHQKTNLLHSKTGFVTWHFLMCQFFGSEFIWSWPINSIQMMKTLNSIHLMKCIGPFMKMTTSHYNINFLLCLQVNGTPLMAFVGSQNITDRGIWPQCPWMKSQWKGAGVSPERHSSHAKNYFVWRTSKCPVLPVLQWLLCFQ